MGLDDNEQRIWIETKELGNKQQQAASSNSILVGGVVVQIKLWHRPMVIR